MQVPHTSIALLGNASEVDVSLQEIGNEFEVFPWGKKAKNKIGNSSFLKLTSNLQMRPLGRKTHKSGHQVSWTKAALFQPPKTSEHVDFATLPPPLALISFRQQRTLSQATVSLVIM